MSVNRRVFLAGGGSLGAAGLAGSSLSKDSRQAAVSDVDGERDWRRVLLYVDDNDFEPLGPLPEVLEHFSEARLAEARQMLTGLNNRLSGLFAEVECAERALRRSEQYSPLMREVRQHVRRVLAGWESQVLSGFDRADMALHRGVVPHAARPASSIVGGNDGSTQS